MKTKTKLSWSALSEPERNALIAEKVMGWFLVRHRGATLNGYFRTDEGYKRPNYFRPTTDPADCAKVKERFEEWEMSKIQHRHPFRVATFYNVKIGASEATAPTECEAFCLAALRASGVEIED